jgi:hypothetical protein
MNAEPYHPQGIGMHGELTSASWRAHQRTRFRGLGKRIALDGLPPEAFKAAVAFIANCKGGEES